MPKPLRQNVNERDYPGTPLGQPPQPLPNTTTPEVQNLTPQKPPMPKHMQRPMKHKVKFKKGKFAV